MSKLLTRLIRIIVLGLLSLFFMPLAACNPVTFSTSNQVAAGGPAATGGGTPTTPTTCTGGVESILRPTKILFVVDTSGSNAQATYNPCSQGPGGYCQEPATDPQKVFRGGAISRFLSTYRHKTNFDWGFVTFAGSSAHAYINNGNDQSPAFSTDPNMMQFALNSFAAVQDDGMTPYHAALAMAAQAVANDPDARSAAKPNYFVILLTDGFPTDYYDSHGNFMSSVMQSDVQALLQAAPGQVSLSTIYYGTVADPNAISLLQTMASDGGGQFANVDDPSTTSFKIDDVIPGVTSTCQ